MADRTDSAVSRARSAETPSVVRAEAKFVRVSPRKARLVVDHIRGRTVPEARTILAFTTRAVAVDVEKVLRSAVANAESNPNLRWNGDDLYITSANVDEGPTIKRWRARARGRVSSIKKRTCHITITVAQFDDSDVAAAPAPKAEAPATEEKPKRTRAPRKKKKKEATA
jgi:large subunit ribosomal protein L22